LEQEDNTGQSCIVHEQNIIDLKKKHLKYCVLDIS